MKIKRVEYKRLPNKQVIPCLKIVLEIVEDNVYLVKQYNWDRITEEWYPSLKTAMFNGTSVEDTGVVKIMTLINIYRYFELLLKYERFERMEDDESNTDNSKELAFLRNTKNTEENLK